MESIESSANWKRLNSEIKGIAILREWLRLTFSDGISNSDMLETYQTLTGILFAYGISDDDLPKVFRGLHRSLLEKHLQEYGIKPGNIFDIQD